MTPFDSSYLKIYPLSQNFRPNKLEKNFRLDLLIINLKNLQFEYRGLGEDFDFESQFKSICKKESLLV